MRVRRPAGHFAGLVLAGLLVACGAAGAPPAAAPPTSAPAATATLAPAPPTAAAPAGKPAPELGNLQWFNAQPMKLSELRGKAVLLVFWSTI